MVNEVRREFNGWGQLIKEYQEHGGAVSTSTSARMTYYWTETTNGTNMHSRPDGFLMPNGADFYDFYIYGDGLDNRISRVSGTEERTGHDLGLYYLGLDTVVWRSNPVTFMTLIGTGTGDAGDQYVGLDRFGRIVDLTWSTGGSGATIMGIVWGNGYQGIQLSPPLLPFGGGFGVGTYCDFQGTLIWQWI